MSEFAKGMVFMYNDKHRKTALKFLNKKKNEDNNMPNKYSILPTESRYNKNLSFGEKILYAEITACADEIPHVNATSLQSTQSNFEILWSIYPNQSERERAEIAFTELSPDTDLLDRISTDVELRKVSDEWLSGNIPYLCNYLIKRKWER